MRSRILLALAASVALASAGCTDAGRARAFSYGKSATVMCYSAGETIYQGASSGKVKRTWGGVVLFVEQSSGAYVEVTGDCVVKYG